MDVEIGSPDFIPFGDSYALILCESKWLSLFTDSRRFGVSKKVSGRHSPAPFSIRAGARFLYSILYSLANHLREITRSGKGPMPNANLARS
jgi:hypothetical protein